MCVCVCVRVRVCVCECVCVCPGQRAAPRSWFTQHALRSGMNIRKACACVCASVTSDVLRIQMCARVCVCVCLCVFVCMCVCVCVTYGTCAYCAYLEFAYVILRSLPFLSVHSIRHLAHRPRHLPKEEVYIAHS
jgi:hypothetical protein